MITDADIARINFLAKKLKSEGLTSAELEEQKFLRRAFIDNIKSQVKQQLESIEYVDELNGEEKCGCGCGEKHHHHHHDHEGHGHHHEDCGCEGHGHHHDESKHEHHEHKGHHHDGCACGGHHEDEKH